MSNETHKTSVLFVCMGNICRSPTAEGVFRHVVTEAGLADRFEIDSAGTHAYHVGEPADRRSRAAAERRGISLDGIAARRVELEDYEKFDYVLAMDSDNLRHMQDQADADYQERIRLFLEFAPSAEDEVPDPYYGGAAGFERVLDLVTEASRTLLETLRSRHSI
jgi:protein-tyrosine phosphatase